jgi:hypothetical protein
MTKEAAQLVGRNEALKFVTVGLIIAYLIMALLAGFSWFLLADYQLNLLIAIAAMYACGYFYGRLAGVAILIKGKGYLWIGFLYGFLTLITATFISSWTGFFQQGIKEMGEVNDPFGDYIFKPLFLVTIVGLIPVSLVGFWFGHRIRKKGTALGKTPANSL